MAGASPRLRVVLGVLGAAVLALAGCGGGDDDESSDVVAQPEPNEPISTQVDAFNEAIANQDCEQLAPLGISLTRPHLAAGTPPSKSECRDTMPVLKRLDGVEMEDSVEFGTGALSEGTPIKGSGAERSIAVWVVDRDGSYHVLLTADTGPQLDTEVVDEDAEVQAASDFVQATEDGDCRTITGLLDPGGRLAAGSAKEECNAIAHGQLFAPALEKTPDPELEFLGGTRGFSFVGVPTADAYFTIVLGIKNEGGKVAPTILDVLPSTDIELPSPQKG